MAHTCHAAGCSYRVPPEMFMCKRHWYSLPKQMRDRIWQTYREGQCDDWQISSEYADAAREAVKWLGIKEGIPEAKIAEACQVYDMLDPKRYEDAE